MILLDVNIWLAAVWARHSEHRRARAWFDAQDDALAFCRVTQMAVLRLLSNPAILGADAVSRAGAWGIVDRLVADPRVTLVDEPTQLELAWRALSTREDQSHRLWTDDYLAAFAQASGMTIVTLDRAFAARFPVERVRAID